jgi:iron complex outermembrane receptor protein
MRTGPITWALAAACVAALSAPAQAQAGVISYDIPAGSLKSALDAYGRQSGRAIIYRSDEVRGIRSRGYRGPAQADEALAKLLAGTGFIAREGGAGSVAIVRVADNQPRAASYTIDETSRDIQAAL